MRRLVVRAAAAAFCALSLSGCVDSAGPILPDAKPLFGELLRLQFYTLHKGFADEPNRRHSSETARDTFMLAAA